MGAPIGNRHAVGNKGGAPTHYNAKFVKIAQELCRRGGTDGEIAEALQISRFTLAAWRGKHEDFANAFRLGREAADERVIRSGYERAVGYTFDSEKIVTVDKQVERVPIKEHVPPDPGMIQYWLNNRRRGEWRNRQEIEVGAPGEFERLSDEELRRFIEADALEPVNAVAPSIAAPAPGGIAARKPAKRAKPIKSALEDDLFG